MREVVSHNRKTGTIHEPKGGGVYPACQNKENVNSDHFVLAFRSRVDGDECGLCYG